ncbi:MAG: nitroreductase family protein [Desulfobacterales bacterium]|nr:nitroreductase family protein [Desulfobacterales bacterium]
MEFKEVIETRRSVNFFDSSKDIPEKILRELVETAAKTPSSFNLQPWSLIVVKNHDEKLRLRKLAWDQPKVSEAPVVFIVLADREAWEEKNQFSEKNFKEMIKAGSMKEEQRQWYFNTTKALYGDGGERSQAFACKNTGFFAMSLMLAAKNLGVDTHPMDGFDHDGVKKEFNIPDNYWVPVLISAGYFDTSKDIFPPKWRKTYEEIVITFK